MSGAAELAGLAELATVAVVDKGAREKGTKGARAGSVHLEVEESGSCGTAKN